MPPLAEWAGRVQFFELVFGTWIFYLFTIFVFEVLLKTKLAEWRYLLMTFIGASFFLINHYYQHAPFYLYLLWGYSLVFLVIWIVVGIRFAKVKLWLKIVLSIVIPVVATVAFIMFEHIAQWGVEGKLIPGRCMNEFIFMLISYFGYIAVIVFRGRAVQKRNSAALP